MVWRAAAQAFSAAAHDARRTRPATTTGKTARLAGAIFLHVLGQLVELLRGYAQRFGRMRANRRHHFVVQVSDDFLFFAFEFLGCFAELRVQLASKILEPLLA